MKRALSVENVESANFKTLDFTGQWFRAVGRPQLTGSWIIYGPPKHGKTTFGMMLVKYLSSFERCAYDSIEEGLSLTIQLAMKRVNMSSAGGRVLLLDQVEMKDLVKYLDRHKSPNIIVVDSIQFAEMTFSQYKRIKQRFPKKLFIYVSHVEGSRPEGQVAKRIWRDANVVWRVEGHRAFPDGRYEGAGEPIDVWPERAAEYWGLGEAP